MNRQNMTTYPPTKYPPTQSKDMQPEAVDAGRREAPSTEAPLENVHAAAQSAHTQTGAERVVYIVGRGRSGSTILSGLLSHLDSIVDVGELIYPMEKLCGCGQSFETCEFWQSVRAGVDAEAPNSWSTSIRTVRDQAHLKNFLGTLFASAASAEVAGQQAINRRIARAILAAADAEIMLDSSKQPTRALFLMRHHPQTRFLHIVRSPDGYLYSYMRRIQRGEVNFFRRTFRSGPLNFVLLALVAGSWFIANFQTEIVRLFDRNRMLRIRFEDLTTDPYRELERIGAFLDLDTSSIADAVRNRQVMRVDHTVGGNGAVREKGGFFFEPRAGEHAPLPLRYRLLNRIINWPLMLLYRYPLRNRAAERARSVETPAGR